MTLRRTLGILFGGALFGFIFGVILAGDENVSVSAWVGVGAIVVVVAMVRDVLEAAKVEFTPLIPAWSRRPSPASTQYARDFRIVWSSVKSALGLADSFERSLRPRLINLAEYHIPRRLGVEAGSARAQDLLGDTAWLIDPEAVGRVPTVDELDEFVTIVMGQEAGTP